MKIRGGGDFTNPMRQLMNFLLPKMICSHLEQGEMTKNEEELPQLCMCDMTIAASTLSLIAIHTQPWQLLPFILLQKLADQDVKHLFAQHF